MRETLEPESDAQVVQLAAALRDALAGYAVAETADAILREALSDAGRTGVPRAAGELDAFVRDHVASIVHRRLGPGIGATVHARLAPFVEAVRRMEPDADASPADAAPASLSGTAEPSAIAVVLSGSPLDASRLARALRAPVQRIGDAGQLRTVIETRADARLVLAIDCRFPNPLVSSARYALEPSALDGALVVLWGGNADTERHWAQRFAAARVIRTSIDADVDEIAARIDVR